MSHYIKVRRFQKLIFLLIGVFLKFLCGASYAMDFRIVTTEHGVQALYGTGPIRKGDDERLLRSIEGVTLDYYGNRLLFLDSPGGDVSAAIAIAEVVNTNKLTTIVGWNDKCISACSSIVWLSGDIRKVIGNGVLGFHSCYGSNMKQHLECNELLAQRAIGEGVAHGDLKAWLMNPNIEELIYFDEVSADCWKLTRWEHQVENVSFSRCAEALLFGHVTSYRGNSRVKIPVPAKNIALFAQGILPQEKWSLDVLDDGLRAFFIDYNKSGEKTEFSVSCNEQIPGQLFLAFGNDRYSASSSLPKIDSVVIDLDGVALSFGSAHPSIRIFDENGRTDIIVMMPKNLTLPILKKTSAVSVQAISSSGQTVYSQRNQLVAGRKKMLEAAYNCTYQYLHSGLERK